MPAPGSPEERDQAVRYFQGRIKPFTQEEVQDLLGVERTTLWRYRSEGTLRCCMPGRNVRYHVEDIYRFLMSQTI